MRVFLCAAAFALSFVSQLQAQVRITEWAYSVAHGEYVEFTNLGPAAVDFTGWSYDDSGRLPGAFDISGFGSVAVGESVVMTEALEADFRTAWNLPASVKVIGENTHNLSSDDEINLYDSTDTLVDRLTYGHGDFPGSIRTQHFSGNPLSNAALGANDPYQWKLSAAGDVYGSYASLPNIDDAIAVGNPGIYNAVPEPTGLVLTFLALSGLGLIRR